MKTEQLSADKLTAAMELAKQMDELTAQWEPQGERMEVIALAVGSWIDTRVGDRPSERQIVPALFNMTVANVMASHATARQGIPPVVYELIQAVAERARIEGLTPAQANEAFRVAVEEAQAGQDVPASAVAVLLAMVAAEPPAEFYPEVQEDLATSMAAEMERLAREEAAAGDIGQEPENIGDEPGSIATGRRFAGNVLTEELPPEAAAVMHDAMAQALGNGLTPGAVYDAASQVADQLSAAEAAAAEKPKEPEKLEPAPLPLIGAGSTATGTLT